MKTNMAIKRRGIFLTQIYFFNNFIHRPNFKNLSDSFPKVCVGYQTAWFRTRYILALQNSTFIFWTFYLRDVALGHLSFRRFVALGCLSH